MDIDDMFVSTFIFCRLTGFTDSWKKLEKWYTSFNILQKVNVNLKKDAAYDRVHNTMLDTRDKVCMYLISTLTYDKTGYIV